MTYFEAQGWTRAQVAGIVANLDAEKRHGRLEIRQIGGGPGYGLGQWEEPRQSDLRCAWAGHDIRSSTFQEQLEFVQHDVSTTEGAVPPTGCARRAMPGDGAAIVCR